MKLNMIVVITMWLPRRACSQAGRKAQAAPKHQYTVPLFKGSSPNFVVLDNFTIIASASREGAIDLRNIRNGERQKLVKPPALAP